MYELLTIYKLRREQENFYAFAQDEIVAASVLQMAEQEIRAGQA
jgi:hypothetical protein